MELKISKLIFIKMELKISKLIFIKIELKILKLIFIKIELKILKLIFIKNNYIKNIISIHPHNVLLESIKNCIINSLFVFSILYISSI